MISKLKYIPDPLDREVLDRAFDEAVAAAEQSLGTFRQSVGKRLQVSEAILIFNAEQERHDYRQMLKACGVKVQNRVAWACKGVMRTHENSVRPRIGS